MAFNPVADPVDVVIIAGRTSPGLAEISGAGSPRNWEERKGYGYGGAFVVFRGIKLAAFTVTFKLTTEEHFEEWESFVEILKRPPHVTPASTRVRGAATGSNASAQAGAGSSVGAATGAAAAAETARAPRGFLSPYGPRPRALDIFHPILSDLGISSCVVVDLLQPKDLGLGEWGYDVKFLEYRQPVFQLAAPDGSTDNEPSGNQARIARADARNERLRRQLESPQQNQALAAELD